MVFGRGGGWRGGGAGYVTQIVHSNDNKMDCGPYSVMVYLHRSMLMCVPLESRTQSVSILDMSSTSLQARWILTLNPETDTRGCCTVERCTSCFNLWRSWARAWFVAKLSLVHSAVLYVPFLSLSAPSPTLNSALGDGL